VKHNQTSSLRERAFTGDQDKLDEIFSTILLGGGRDEATRDIEAVARVESDVLTVLIQRHVEGITVSSYSYVICDMRSNIATAKISENHVT
jgi:hypothetical protein